MLMPAVATLHAWKPAAAATANSQWQQPVAAAVNKQQPAPAANDCIFIAISSSKQQQPAASSQQPAASSQQPARPHLLLLLHQVSLQPLQHVC
jgi:hypothetical protein